MGYVNLCIPGIKKWRPGLSVLSNLPSYSLRTKVFSLTILNIIKS